MTDNDRVLLAALVDTCDRFCLIMSNIRFSQEDHIEMATMFLGVADRILSRIADNPQVATSHE